MAAAGGGGRGDGRAEAVGADDVEREVGAAGGGAQGEGVGGAAVGAAGLDGLEGDQA